MAIKVNGQTVIDDSRQLTNITSVDATTVAALGTAGVGGGFEYASVSGASQNLDLNNGNFFDAGDPLETNVTLSFSNVPTEAKWEWSATMGAATSHDLLNQTSTGYSISLGQAFRNLRVLNNGTRLYTISSGTDKVYEYELTTPYRISTATILRNFSVSGQVTSAHYDVEFKPDGTKMYTIDINGHRVYQYNLSTPWNIGTASYSNKSFSASGQSPSQITSLTFKPDGTKLYLSAVDYGYIYQYSLSTAWDVSTASYDNVYLNSVGSNDNFMLEFNNDGTQLFLGEGGKLLYDLTTAYDISTASYTGSVSGQRFSTFSEDGLYIYQMNDSGTIYQWISGSAPTITLPSSVANPYLSSVLAGDTVNYEFFTRDGGSNVYVIGEEKIN